MTFVHPCDGASNGASNGAQQATPLPMTKSTSSSSSKTSLQRVQTRLGIRPAGSRDPIGIGSSRGQRLTDAQHLYSSSLKQEPKVAVSPTLSRRPSLSSIYADSASSISEEAIAADRPSMPPAVHPNSSAQNSQSYTQRVTINSTTTSGPSLPPIHSPRSSHDHKKVFDYTRLSCEARNVTSDAPFPGPGQSQSFAPLPPTSSPYGHILPLNIVRRSTTHRYNFSADSKGRWNGSDQISSDVHALYPSQALFHSKGLRPSRPPSNVSRQPSVRHSSNNNNVTTAAPGNQDRQTANQLPSNNQKFPIILNPPIMTTGDKDPSPTSMVGAPNGRSLASANSATGDNLFGVPAPSQPVASTQTIVPEIQSSSDFNNNTQYQDLSWAFQTQANLTRRQTIASFPIAEQQPLRPLRAVPANMNMQLQASRNAELDEGSEKGRSRYRKSFKRSRLSLFGQRTKEVS